MKAAWTGQFQVVLVWRFDRFARSVKHLVAALETFRTLHVGFVSLQEQLDTSTPIGQAMFTIIGAMAAARASDWPRRLALATVFSWA
jgi:DNA invertase Pin-like site-specific DNA recombinase